MHDEPDEEEQSREDALLRPGTSTAPHHDWWQTYFDDDFLELYRPHLPRRRTRREVAGVQEMLGLPVGSKILDLACGWGRHTLPLTEAGYRVCGLDRSEFLLSRARDRAGSPVEAPFICGDMRQLPLRPDFDAVLSLFSSLGYFLDDAEDLRVLTAVRTALVPGGLFLLDTMHRDRVVRDFVQRDWWEAGGRAVRVERDFDAISGIYSERLWWSAPAADGTKEYAMRIRTATEWARLLAAAGLQPLHWYGGWDSRDFTERSPRLIIVAAAAGEPPARA